MTNLKRAIIIALLIVVSMLILPLIAVNTIRSIDGMSVVIFMFFAINPIVSVYTGILSGQNTKGFWWTPIIIAVLFWTFSSFIFETAFPVFYSAMYFVISSVSMIITKFVYKKYKKDI